MSTGITASLVCDPTLKREIWLFQEIGLSGGRKGTPLYRRLPYNLVSWDGDPTQYIEPVNASGDFVRGIGETNVGAPLDPRVDGAGLVAGFQFCKARPFEVFSLNDLDVAGNLGQLPS